MNPQVDTILAEGCGRCKLVGTPQCKMMHWQKEMTLLREIALASGLEEEVKWGQPTYTLNSKNIILIHSFKEYCGVLFFKGALLADSENILVQQTENVQAARQARFTNLKDVQKSSETLKIYIFEAIEIEKSGVKIEAKKTSDYPMPDELKHKFKELPELKAAFENLTPGRQRGYLLHFSQAKQSATRLSRIEKNMEAIFNGKGLNE
jgi:uncharacterized protein YdeI (YjbR/CyaY-like superfamily)